MITQCIYCKHTKLYKLANGYLKCASCKRKISPAKIEKSKKLIIAFCRNLTAYEASRIYRYSYMTTKTHYEHIRLLITQYLEEQYNKHTKEIKEFDEYFYLEKSKKRDENTIFDIQNFLTFDYGGKVYNILMPSLRKYRYMSYENLLHFITFQRVAKLKRLDNTIVKFWNFFEEGIKRYRGVDKENFIYYLKEFEFKFNYTQEEQKNILLELIEIV